MYLGRQAWDIPATVAQQVETWTDSANAVSWHASVAKQQGKGGTMIPPHKQPNYATVEYG